MSTNAVREKESATVSQRFNDFLTRYKTLFAIMLTTILVAVIGLGLFTAISEANNKKAYTFLEDAEISLEKAKNGTDQAAITAAEDEVLASVQKYTGTANGNFVKTRAYMLIAEVYFSRKDWNAAQAAYIQAYESSPKAYTAGLNAFNAAVCADEAGNQDTAIELFNKALASEGFSQASRTMFNIARIEEQRGNTEAAIKMYENLFASYSDDEWSILAKSRHIALTK
ncbi:MAG TPA: tetratricopeptide repeat protein [Treponemataceae bacterium]|nr:tetratricopeptide repeat protein [Treponemataceae bacterium]